jgi:AcrR family transcriptional regulator
MAARPTGAVAKGPHDVIEAATNSYLRGEPLDMSALAAQLGIGRATLYRWVGNREELLANVIAETSERTFRAVVKDASGEGVAFVVDAIGRFMQAVASAEPLQTLTQREPLLFIRLAMSPGVIEDRAATFVGELLDQEVAAGRLQLALPVPVLAEAIVRLCDAHLYANLLGRGAPEISTALDLVSLLLGSRPAPHVAAAG